MDKKTISFLSKYIKERSGSVILSVVLSVASILIGFVPYLVDTESTTIKSNLEELYNEHEEDNLVFKNIIKRSNKISTWSKTGITENRGYDKKVLSMYEKVFFEMLERMIQLEDEKAS